MGSRVLGSAAQQYTLSSSSSNNSRSAAANANPNSNSYNVVAVGSSSLQHHDLSDADPDAVTHDSLEDDDEDQGNHQHSNPIDCMHDSYRNSLPLHGVGVEENHSAHETNGSSGATYHVLTVDDILPIENARARFLQIIVDHFINDHMIEVADSEVDYNAQSGQDKLHKRNSRQVQYEGDPRFALPLMYVANLYETLVNDVNIRIAPFAGIREKTIGVALEAAGGLYRRLARKFPKKGPCSFRRRELATSLETRTRFPELVVQEQKRVRFVVVNGLVIVEKPSSVPLEDAEWFKRLTGRHEMAVSAGDYKFYSPRHKYRRVGSNSVSSIPELSPRNDQESVSKNHIHPMQQQPQFNPLRQQNIHQSPQASHFSHTHQFVPPQHLHEIPQVLQSSSMSQHITCMQPLPGRMHILPMATSPAKFCDGCGAPYLRDSSKFCSECGVKRLGT